MSNVKEDFSQQHIERSDQRPDSYNGPEYDQLGPNMIPPILEPQVLDIKHGLNMPDGPTSGYSRTNMDDVSSVNPGNLYDTGSAVPYDADETEGEDANPTFKAGPA